MSKTLADYQAQVQETAFPKPSEEEVRLNDEKRRSDAQMLGMDMLHIDDHLRKHGASLSALLRHGAKAFFGVDVPHLPQLKPAEPNGKDVVVR